MRLVGSRKYFSIPSSVAFLIAAKLKMNSSNMATAQYKNAVLKAYGIVPVKDCFSSSCNNSVHLKRNQSTLKTNHFALSQRRKTTNHKSDGDSLSEDKTHIPLNMEQPSNSYSTDRKRLEITKNDVLKAHGIIIQEPVGKTLDFQAKPSRTSDNFLRP